ncbi:MAG: O-antigen ligase family protein [Chloroflexota bacterium]
MAVAAAICLGVALFGRGWTLRGAALLGSILLLGVTFANTDQSLLRLFSGESLRGRMVLWQGTLDLMNGPQYITGLGLGYWPWAYNDGIVRTGFTHPHNAYVQLYSDTGVIGLLALALALVVSAHLAWKVLRQGRGHPYFGLAVGIVLATVVTLAVGVVEAAPTGIPVVAKEAYHYVISPAAFLLGGMLVVLHRLGLEGAGEASKEGGLRSTS